MTSLGYPCEHCDGTVRAKTVGREMFKHRSGFVILTDVDIGVCDKCGNRYYEAGTVKQVHAVATGASPAADTEQVPIAAAVQAV